MKKLLLVFSLLSIVAISLVVPHLAFAAGVDINISAPAEGVNPKADAGKVLGNIITIIFVVAVLAVLFMLILGAFQYITSGGDKEGAGKAQKRITNAIIGLVILAVAFLLVNLLGKIVNVSLLNLHLPSIDEKACLDANKNYIACPTPK